MNRNIIYFGTPAAYLGYLQSVKDANPLQRIEADQGALTTEITDVVTVPFLDETFLVRLSVRQTLAGKSYEMTAYFDSVSLIVETKSFNPASSPFTNIGQPVAARNQLC